MWCRIGAIVADSLKTGAEAYGLNLMTQVVGLSVEEANGLIKEAVESSLTAKTHAYYLQWAIPGLLDVTCNF